TRPGQPRRMPSAFPPAARPRTCSTPRVPTTTTARITASTVRRRPGCTEPSRCSSEWRGAARSLVRMSDAPDTLDAFRRSDAEFYDAFAVGLVVGGCHGIPHFPRAVVRLEELPASSPRPPRAPAAG